MEHLQAYTNSLHAAIDRSFQFESDAAAAAFSQESRLVQSAVLCIEVLVRFLGGQEQWKDALGEHLQLFLTLLTLLGKLPALMQSATATKAAAAEGSMAVLAFHECVKIQSSAALCCATFCSVMGMQIVGTLPVSGPSVALRSTGLFDSAAIPALCMLTRVDCAACVAFDVVRRA